MLAQADPAALPPILVQRGTMRLIDGMHRLQAAQERGDPTIPARFFNGDDDEAFIFAVRANTTHGLPLTLDDRKAAARQILLSRPRWSDRMIGACTGLAARTVSVIRRSSVDANQSNIRVGADGRPRPLCAVDGRRRAARLIAENPQMPLRKIAAEAGISVGTAHDVRKRMRSGRDPVNDAAPTGARAAVPGQPSSMVDSESILQALRADPALRLSDSGRDLLRWLYAHAADIDEWVTHADTVPPRHVDEVLKMARYCAQEWSRFADSLEQRGFP